MQKNIRIEKILELWVTQPTFDLLEMTHQTLYGGQPLVRRKLDVNSLISVQKHLKGNPQVDKTFMTTDLTNYTHVFIYRKGV